MNGKHPELGEEPVKRTVCWEFEPLDSDCYFSEDITIVACGETDNVHFLYQLSKPSEHCTLNYCAV